MLTSYESKYNPLNRFDPLDSAMRKMTILELLVVLAVGICTMPALADNMTPITQWKQGVPIEEIQCSDTKTLMISPSEKPSCIKETTVHKLEDRGWQIVSTTSKNTVKSDTTNPYKNKAEPLRRHPVEYPILNRNYTGLGEELTLTHQELLEQKHQSGPSGQSGDFRVSDWIPEYIPSGYVLGHTLHGWHTSNNQTIHGLELYFVPTTFEITNSTTERDIRENGIIYRVGEQDGLFDSYENRKRHLASLIFNYSDAIISDLIVNQTNGYFGVEKPDNGHPGYNAEVGFGDYDVFVWGIDLSHDEGRKIINSVNGVIIPE